jgi:Zn-dependent protease with chaperone function
MKPLEHYSIGQRIAITFIIVLVILFGLAFIGWVTGGWEAPAAVQVPIDPRHERKFIDLDRAAIEEAYRDQIQHLFEVWMKDDSGQPARAVKGARQARKAFADSMDAIDERERQLKEMQR